MLSISEVNSAIMTQVWTDIELRSMIDSVQWNRSRLAQRTKASLNVGDNVQFTSSKTGRQMRGSITKIAIKYVTVSVPGWGSWKVPANMLTVVDKELA